MSDQYYVWAWRRMALDPAIGVRGEGERGPIMSEDGPVSQLWMLPVDVPPHMAAQVIDDSVAMVLVAEVFKQ